MRKTKKLVFSIISMFTIIFSLIQNYIYADEVSTSSVKTVIDYKPEFIFIVFLIIGVVVGISAFILFKCSKDIKSKNNNEREE